MMEVGGRVGRRGGGGGGGEGGRPIHIYRYIHVEPILADMQLNGLTSFKVTTV